MVGGVYPEQRHWLACEFRRTARVQSIRNTERTERKMMKFVLSMIQVFGWSELIQKVQQQQQQIRIWGFFDRVLDSREFTGFWKPEHNRLGSGGIKAGIIGWWKFFYVRPSAANLHNSGHAPPGHSFCTFIFYALKIIIFK